MPRGCHVGAGIRMPTLAGVAGVAPQLTHGRYHLLGEGVICGGYEIAVVGVTAFAGVARISLLFAGRRQHRCGIHVGDRRQHRLHSLAALNASSRGRALGSTGRGYRDLPGGRRVVMLLDPFHVTTRQKSRKSRQTQQKKQRRAYPYSAHTHISFKNVSSRTSAKIRCISRVGWLM